MKKFFAFVLMIVFFASAHSALAQSLGGGTYADSIFGIPFGGIVTTVQPCNTGLLAYVKTARTVTPVMWFWGNLPYASYIPPHPGQYLLGKLGTGIAPCVLGTIPYGGGAPILFHGSSI